MATADDVNQDGVGDPSDPSSAKSRRGSALAIVLVVAVLAIPLMIILAVIAAIIPGLPWWVGILVGLLVAVAIVGRRMRNLVGVMLADLGARPAGADDHARFHNLVQGLTLAGGVSEPDLFVIDDPARNAAVLARGDSSAIVATTGLLDSLDRVALEGVIAETLVRVRSGDAEAATVAAALLGTLLGGPAGPLLKPVAGVGLSGLLSSDRDLLADRDAVALTRYPPGLYSALTTIRAGSASAVSWSPANDYVWLVPPSVADESETVNSAGPVSRVALDLRIDVLGEL